MKVLITGGSGFIGSHIAERFHNEGNEVFVVDNLSTGKEKISHSSMMHILSRKCTKS